MIKEQNVLQNPRKISRESSTIKIIDESSLEETSSITKSLREPYENST
jgi:hypothetical protein